MSKLELENLKKQMKERYKALSEEFIKDYSEEHLKKIIYALQKNKKIAKRIDANLDKYWKEKNEERQTYYRGQKIAHERSEESLLLNIFGKERARALEDLSRLEFIITCLEEEEDEDGEDVIPKFYPNRDNILFMYEKCSSILMTLNSYWEGSVDYSIIDKKDIDMNQVFDEEVSIW